MQSSEWSNVGDVRELQPRATPWEKGQIGKRINAESVRERPYRDRDKVRFYRRDWKRRAGNRVWHFRELFQSSDDLNSLVNPGRCPGLKIANAFGVVVDEMHNSLDDLNALREKLRALDAEFDREMRTRGFDPAQAENVALPSHLAALYAERETIKAQIEESEGTTDD